MDARKMDPMEKYIEIESEFIATHQKTMNDHKFSDDKEKKSLAK